MTKTEHRSNKTKTFHSKSRPRRMGANKDQTQDFYYIYVLEEPRGQDRGLEDCNTGLI